MLHPQQSPRSPRGRSAVTTGTRALIGVDHRSAEARRFRDLIEDLSAGLGDELTAVEILQVRNVATLQLLSEQMAAAVARGDQVDPDAATRAANGAVRALAGLRRLRPPLKGRERRTAHDVLAARRMAAE